MDMENAMELACFDEPTGMKERMKAHGVEIQIILLYCEWNSGNIKSFIEIEKRFTTIPGVSSPRRFSSSQRFPMNLRTLRSVRAPSVPDSSAA